MKDKETTERNKKLRIKIDTWTVMAQQLIHYIFPIN